jgi:tetratricopeptide (TPR) repeat protein
MTTFSDYRHGHNGQQLSRRPGLAGLTGVLLAAICIAACGTGRRPTPAHAPSSGPVNASATGSGLVVAVESHDPQLSNALGWLLVDRSAARLVAVGNRYYQLRIRDKAMDYYSEAITLGDTHAGALDGRARILRDWGFLDEALEDVLRAVGGSPDSAAAVNTFGTILQTLGRHDEAAVVYARAADLDRAAPYAMTNLCYLSFLAGRLDDAARDCSHALTRSNGFAPARNNLALTYAAAGQADTARAFFLDSTDDAAGHYNLGIVLLAQKRYAEAAAHFHSATRKNPSFAAAHRRARQAERAAAIERNSSHARH